MRIVLLTRAMHSSAEVLPALALLNHSVRVLGAEPASLLAVDNSDVLLVDGRMDLPAVPDRAPKAVSSTPPHPPPYTHLTPPTKRRGKFSWGGVR